MADNAYLIRCANSWRIRWCGEDGKGTLESSARIVRNLKSPDPREETGSQERQGTPTGIQNDKDTLDPTRFPQERENRSSIQLVLSGSLAIHPNRGDP